MILPTGDHLPPARPLFCALMGMFAAVFVLFILTIPADAQQPFDSPIPTPGAPPVPIVDTRSLRVAALVSSVWIVIPPLVVELVPAWRERWDTTPANVKRATRAWSGLAIAVALVAVHFLGWYDLGLGERLDFVAVFVVIVGWIVFVFGQEATYQGVKVFLPRKQRDPNTITDGVGREWKIIGDD